jgi:hypothetical protein
MKAGFNPAFLALLLFEMFMCKLIGIKYFFITFAHEKRPPLKIFQTTGIKESKITGIIPLIDY